MPQRYATTTTVIVTIIIAFYFIVAVIVVIIGVVIVYLGVRIVLLGKLRSLSMNMCDSSEYNFGRMPVNFLTDIVGPLLIPRVHSY